MLMNVLFVLQAWHPNYNKYKVWKYEKKIPFLLPPIGSQAWCTPLVSTFLARFKKIVCLLFVSVLVFNYIPCPIMDCSCVPQGSKVAQQAVCLHTLFLSLFNIIPTSAIALCLWAHTINYCSIWSIAICIYQLEEKQWFHPDLFFLFSLSLLRWN